MRRKDNEKDRDFAFEVIDKCSYATLSMSLPDGKPYAVPISVARSGNALYFHCAKEGAKLDAMRKNPYVCVVCVGSTRELATRFTMAYESAVVFGKAGEIYDDAEKIFALRMLSERYTPLNMPDFDKAIEKNLAQASVWRIEIDEITGKCNDVKERE
mgnify:CR=1 FL=1